MSYIGRQPLVGNYISCDALTASATTTYNLTSGGSAVSPQTAANCIVSLNGVVQAPTSSYTISGSTIIFSTTLSSSDTIDYITVLGNVLNIGTPTNGTVTTSSLASGFSLPATQGGTGTTTYTAGNILYASNSTTLTTLAPGTSGYGLTLNGTTPAWTAPPTSDVVLLASTEASSSASVSFDGYFSSTYKNYKIIFSQVIPATNSVNFYMRFRRSNADVTASNYKWAQNGFNLNSTPDATNSVIGNYNTNYVQIGTDGIPNTTSYAGISGEGTFFNPLNTASWKSIIIQSNNYYNNNNNYYGFLLAAMLQDSTAALSGLSFYFSSGNIASGNFKLYGIK